GIHSVSLNGEFSGAGYLSVERPAEFDLSATTPETDSEPENILSCKFGGTWIADDTVSGTVVLPDDLADGDTFWVSVLDGQPGEVFTKAIELRVTALEDGGVSFHPLQAKYDASSVHSDIAGDFAATQAHFSTNGINAPLGNSINSAGYGIHSVSLNGEFSGAGYLSHQTPAEFHNSGAVTLNGDEEDIMELLSVSLTEAGATDFDTQDDDATFSIEYL
ncbi:MAG: hypothetical protein JJT81_20165, partial [Rubellimicrobium sp.]|nr:hypothetical protein [Rubellimicrobium sp.]